MRGHCVAHAAISCLGRGATPRRPSRPSSAPTTRRGTSRPPRPPAAATAMRLMRPPCGRFSSSPSSASSAAPIRHTAPPIRCRVGFFSFCRSPVSSAARASTAASEAAPSSARGAATGRGGTSPRRAARRPRPRRARRARRRSRRAPGPAPPRPSPRQRAARLVIAPPKPGTAATRLVTRPTRRTHQRERSCMSICRPCRGARHPGRGEPVEHAVAQLPVDLRRPRPPHASRGPAGRTGRRRSAPRAAGRVGAHERAQHRCDIRVGIGPFVGVRVLRQSVVAAHIGRSS